MSDGEAGMRALLRELDDPEWQEWPRGYDRIATGARFGRLVARFEEDFAASCPNNRDEQDSSEYGRVTVPAAATVRGTRIVVCVSKFGTLAVVCADNPGAFLGTDEAVAEGELDAADLARVRQALTALGYSVVSEELLEEEYTGPSPASWFSRRPTWSDRFFGTF